MLTSFFILPAGIPMWILGKPKVSYAAGARVVAARTCATGVHSCRDATGIQPR